MKYISITILFVWLLLQPTFIFAEELNDPQDECTIGVASGKVTADGRPMVWKTRDYKSSPNNEINLYTASSYDFVSVVSAGSTTPWMGVNEAGFAIVNALSTDLPGGSSGPGNGTLMKTALGTCASIAEFEQLLDQTNESGRTTRSNFGVIDALGGAAIFETGGDVHWKFDANDSTIAPEGYVLRTNFAFNGSAKNGLNNSLNGIERFRRQQRLMSEFSAGDTLNYRSIIRYQMRDFAYSYGDPVPVPFDDQWQLNRPHGYIYSYKCICRSTSVSAAVIQGVLPDESPLLSTLWGILGQPAGGIAVPYWPAADVPQSANGLATAPLCDVARQIRTQLYDYAPHEDYIDSYKLRDGIGGGLWTVTFPVEDSIFVLAEEKLAHWRNDTLISAEMTETVAALAEFALQTLTDAYTNLTTSIAVNNQPSIPSSYSLHQNFPNPFNPTTTVSFELPGKSDVTLTIYNLRGERITTLVRQQYPAGIHAVKWNAQGQPSGIYVYKIRAIPAVDQRQFSATRKLTLLK